MGNSELVLQWSKLLPLTVDNIETLSGKEGVYRVSRKALDEKFYVIFIGSSSDLMTELLSIMDEKAFLKEKYEFSFRYSLVSGAEIRKAVEKKMYKQYAPTYNTKEPDSTLDIKVNLN